MLNPWQRRAIIFAATLGSVTCICVVAAITWAVLYIHHDRAHLVRVTGTIISVDGSKRSSSGRGIHFGTYSLTVRYRTPDGAEVTDRLEKRTFGFPSAGDSIAVLIDPKDGGIEASPFPELWIILALVYAGFGWLVRFFVAYSRRSLRQA
ncbi:MAG TPA: DUF3592 domain-containing protein [Verrucomicrobiae bacterium]|nr:DUF3592 domain-containing protein [Verrucomicrobiae bacterium]